ncbi:MAG TPA: HupE/UreJ family protein [Gemmatimonadaceae bacterium]|nr:HupE/UreJ family protein [Gemmatimonadaceae bacterium]
MARPTAISAHDIPQTVLVRAFIKPDGTRLRLLVRVPLEAMRDVEWPVRPPGYLEIARADSLLPTAAQQWIAHYVEIYEDGKRITGEQLVATRITLPSDPSFASYATALRTVMSPSLPSTVELAWQNAMVDVLFEYPIASDSARFSINPQLAHLGVRTTTILHFLPVGGAERALQYPGNPGLVHLDPRWYQAAGQFVQLGFEHILDGLDHLLFIICLVIPFRRLKPLVVIVTSFTVAHSITLIASALGFAPTALWFPPLVETLIALSIVFMAFENIVGPKLERRWLIAFAFGLIHGFGFSFALRDSLQFAGTHLLTSLLTFNVGVEIGQIFVVALALPVLHALFKYVTAERIGTIILSALVAHTAWHWMLERGAALTQYDFTAPTLDVAFAIATMRALMLLLVAVGIGWMLSAVIPRFIKPAPSGDQPVVEQ